jgi:hypothetical protein
MTKEKVSLGRCKEEENERGRELFKKTINAGEIAFWK